ncbi:hypothetical protein PanWU01x14_010020 [Parasponia andersonii]|uniref:Uncharacterized protein n=1 Tax=Parasponia andersonii TaxID=3476 RepID=A0A2P5E2L8_PARAD|nr:hypothetical protein PanWU01x14_010020 [Parasponia andersonii]
MKLEFQSGTMQLLFNERVQFFRHFGRQMIHPIADLTSPEKRLVLLSGPQFPALIHLQITQIIKATQLQDTRDVTVGLFLNGERKFYELSQLLHMIKGFFPHLIIVQEEHFLGPLGLRAHFPVPQQVVPKRSVQANPITELVKRLLHRVLTPTLGPQPVSKVPERDENVLRVSTEVNDFTGRGFDRLRERNVR